MAERGLDDFQASAAHSVVLRVEKMLDSCCRVRPPRPFIECSAVLFGSARNSGNVKTTLQYWKLVRFIDQTREKTDIIVKLS